MELSCQLSPLAYAQLYAHLTAEPSVRGPLVARLEDIGCDEDILADLAARYRALWNVQVKDAGGDPTGLWPLDDRHARLATWLLAGLRRRSVPSQEFSLVVRKAIDEEFQTHFGNVRLPDLVQPTVIAWTLGQVYGGLDVALPAVPAVDPTDVDVALAYAGLVRHLHDLGHATQPWPEVAASATIWRAAGIIDGLKTQPNLTLKDAINEAMTQMKEVTPPHVLRELDRYWDEFRRIRNGLTHVAQRQNGYAFRDVADRACNWEGVQLCVTGVTHMVFNEISLNVLETGGDIGADTLIDEIVDEIDHWTSNLEDG